MLLNWRKAFVSMQIFMRTDFIRFFQCIHENGKPNQRMGSELKHTIGTFYLNTQLMSSLVSTTEDFKMVWKIKHFFNLKRLPFQTVKYPFIGYSEPSISPISTKSVWKLLRASSFSISPTWMLFQLYFTENNAISLIIQKVPNLDGKKLKKSWNNGSLNATLITFLMKISKNSINEGKSLTSISLSFLIGMAGISLL